MYGAPVVPPNLPCNTATYRIMVLGFFSISRKITCSGGVPRFESLDLRFLTFFPSAMSAPT